MAIYSNTGFILANYLPEMIGKQLVDVETQYGDDLDEVAEAVKNAQEWEVASFDPALKTTMYMSIAPIPLAASPTTWSVMIGSTEAFILKDVNAMTSFTAMLMTIVILSAATLIIVLIRVDAAKTRSDAESRHKSAFLANMSHELRTPLNVVIGLTDLILEDEKLDNHTTENLVKISNAGSTLLSIVNDVLDFSKIESGKLTLSPVVYYTSSLLNDIATLTITRLGEKPIVFRLDIPDDLPNKLFGDDLRVKQVLTNLLTNAAKYTQEGSIELKVRCTRETDSVWLDVAVKDTGMGISKENIKSLFSDYYQVDVKANRHIEGTGLGLAITKRLVKMMEGQINVESEKGKGSTFSFRLRQGYVDDKILGADVSDKLRSFSYIDDKRINTQKLVRINLYYARVLVVDDMQTNLDVASGLLSKYQMQVDCLTNGQAAIERIKAGTPAYNAIFMDHMMPGMDGIETVDRIRALGTEYAKKIPIIALTANAIQGTDKMFYAHDFQAFISKPIDVMELDSALRKWVRDDTRETVMVQTEPSSGDEKIEIKIPGVDTKKGLSLYVGDTKVYLSLLRSYIANTPKVLEKLRLVSAENLSDYVITVHGLKGTSAGIGAEEVRKQALELENLSRAGDLKSVLAKNNKLIADAEIIVSNVKEWLDKNDVQDAKPRLKAPNKELLAKLRESCESYDIDGIEQVMSELEKADYEEDADLVKWIREKVDISKMGEVAQRLDKMLFPQSEKGGIENGR
jgi:signal transduction histidine kinase/CheY-like chemotaxis protein/HPt (histidine-containing phosphotransfer) domain-containing protein